MMQSPVKGRLTGSMIFKGCAIVICLLVFNGLKAQDTTPPVIVTPARDTSFECGVTPGLIDKLTAWYNNAGGATATDNSGSVTWTANLTLAQAITAFNNSLDILCGNKQKVTVVFTAVDPSGNMSTPTSAMFFTTDTKGPKILNAVPNKQYNCVAGIRDTLIQWIKSRAGYQAADDCSNSITWKNFNFAITSNNAVIQTGGGNIAIGPYPNIPDGICQWRMNISFIVADECGNETGTPGTTNFSVTDNVAPVIQNAPADITVQCHQVPSVPQIMSVDYCDKTVVPVFSETSTQASDKTVCGYYNYSITRKWIATDECGNTATHTQIITVRDNTPPTFTGPDTVRIGCKVFQSLPDSLYAGASDICSPSSLTFADSLVSTGCLSLVRRTYTATDVCGNRSALIQTIVIKQDTAPLITQAASDRTFECSSQENFNAQLTAWVQSMGGSKARANCDTFMRFAAERGSYDLHNPATYPGILPVSLPPQFCPSSLQGFLRYTQVDFVYYDQCGNVSVTGATFGIRDQQSPVVSNCPQRIDLVTSADGCEVTVKVRVPDAADDCIESSSPVVRRVSEKVTSNGTGPEAIVDPLQIDIGPFNPFTAVPTGNGQLHLVLVDMDIDDVTEYFNVFDEDGTLIGITPVGAGQCATQDFSLVLDSQKVKDWVLDGYITLRFEPNIIAGNPVLSINNICSGSMIQAEVSYEIDISNTVSRSYAIDNGPSVPLNTQDSIEVTLVAGNHQLEFAYEDCAGNMSYCKIPVYVKDETAPQITCPSDMETILSKGVCQDTVSIPVNFSVIENCNGQRKYQKISPQTAEASLISFFYNENTQSHEARSKEITFTDVFSIRHWDGEAKLTIFFEGDNNETGESYEIYGPGGYLLGKTATGSQIDTCGLTVTTFTISSALFNNWIQNGQIKFTAVPLTGPERINPCSPLEFGQSVDGVSTLKAELSYSDFAFTLQVSGATNTGETIIPGDVSQFDLILNAGTNKVSVRTLDGSGNSGTCQFNVRVKDVENPKVKCKNSVVTLHPSGLEPALVLASLIDAGSTDNCRIKSATVVPPSFDCSFANTDQSVSLIVEDEAGNRDSCTASVRIKSPELNPDFTSGLCTDDTLKLFANVPMASVPGTYSFHWTGPNGIEFFTENPAIPSADENYNGVYVLTVTGFNGCVSTGSVSVNIKPLTTPELTANQKEICRDQQLILSSTAYSGNITYQWYEGIFPTGVLVRTSQSPEIILTPDIGVHFYYLIAKGPDCSSNPSSLLKVTVLATPDALVNDAFLSVCEGGQIILGTPVSNSNFTYHWTGPAGYNETGKSPKVILNASELNAGDYFLTIGNGMCRSDTAVTKVVILERPTKPVVTGPEILCEGAIFTLSAGSSANVEKYEWYRDGILFTTTQDNNLIIPDANPALQGSWTVITSSGNCKSEVSAPKFVAVDNSLEIGVINSGPVCMGDSVKLQVTFVPNATYQWEGPHSPIPSVSDPVIPGIPGDYSVTITTPTGCSNNANTRVEVIDVPEITALSNDARACMEISDTIRFFPSVFPNAAGLTYSWSGPEGYASTSRNPFVTGLNLSKNGHYTLTIFNGNCPSETVTTSVSFNLIPQTPLIQGPLFICSGDTLTVWCQAIPAAENYVWSTPLGQVTTTVPLITIYPAKAENSGVYTVSSSSNGCQSKSSASLQIEIRPKPSAPFITGDSLVCFGSSATAGITPQSGITYLWSGPFNPGNTHQLNITSADNTYSGTYRLTLLSNGCYSSPSAPFNLTVKPEIRTPQFITSSISLCKTNAQGAEICLNPGSLEPNATYQIFDQGDNSLVANGNTNCFFITDLSGFVEGANFLIAQTTKDGCTSRPSENLVLSLNTPPQIQATAVEDNITICPGENVRLISASGPPLVSVEWSTPEQEVILSDKTGISTVVSALDEGEHFIYLDYSVDGCPDFSTDTVRIYVEFAPVTTDDEYRLPYGEKGILPVLQNDNIPQNSSLTIVDLPAFGTLAIINGKVEYQPDPRNLKPVEFTYKVCADLCSDLCSESVVRISFDENITCRVPNIITPNEDGYNDRLVIPCLDTEKYPANKFLVFNEWGDEVFYASPYKNDWDGTFGDKPLPAGTYFYILDTGDDQKPFNGFLIIQR